ncbi:hypothetical protein [Goodfellowiella coeruleoviolacea]|uniref:Uncharacterized protein n=1 Tax=Goodfellowiella coeruleoviolacea TaxID=334858 RepID=A0AAE3KI03_9PSEU|nr:hypothetical protein [Goodfellowiella coeruleoviolacea]MCP2167960.1 hypothetical protein [Goodfellowiella coeruleoviolacea]
MTGDSGHDQPAEQTAEHPGELPAQLAEFLRQGPFHRALRVAIAHRGLSLAQVRAHLGRLGVQVGQSTLSYWQRGLRHPEVPRAVPTVRALETVLNLPPNSLLVLVGTRRVVERHRPSVAEAVTPVVSAVDPAQVSQMAQHSRYNLDLNVLAVHDAVLVGARREQRLVTTRVVVRALRHGPDRYLALHQGDQGCQIERVTVRTAEGCRLGRLRRQPLSRGMLVELLFDRRLSAGETHVFCFTVVDGSGGQTLGHHRAFRARCGSYLLQMGFHREAMPVRCVRQVRRRPEAAPAETAEVVCGVGAVASTYFTDVGPGSAGMSVTWG